MSRKHGARDELGVINLDELTRARIEADRGAAGQQVEVAAAGERYPRLPRDVLGFRSIDAHREELGVVEDLAPGVAEHEPRGS